MANDWGKPFTPEEAAKLAATKEAENLDAPNTPPFVGSKFTLTYVDEAHIAPGGDWAKVGRAQRPAPDLPAVIIDHAAKPRTELTRALETIMAPGFGEAEQRTAPVETFSEADGPWYVVYFGPVLYTVLAGPYDTQDAAAERIDRVWAQFEHDAAYDYTFSVRERSGLRATTVRTVFNLKGAYGKQ